MTPREYIEARLTVLRELKDKKVGGFADWQLRAGKIAAYEDALAAFDVLEPKPEALAVTPLTHQQVLQAMREGPTEHVLREGDSVRLQFNGFVGPPQLIEQIGSTPEDGRVERIISLFVRRA